MWIRSGFLPACDRRTRELRTAIDRHVLELTALLLPVTKIEIRGSVGNVLTNVQRPEHRKAVRPMVGKIGEHDGVEHAEDRRVRADADSQGQDRDSRERRRFRQRADGVREVVAHHVEPSRNALTGRRPFTCRTPGVPGIAHGDRQRVPPVAPRSSHPRMCRIRVELLEQVPGDVRSAAVMREDAAEEPGRQARWLDGRPEGHDAGSFSRSSRPFHIRCRTCRDARSTASPRVVTA